MEHNEESLCAVARKNGISTLLIQCPLMGEPARSHIDCIWAQSGHEKGFSGNVRNGSGADRPLLVERAGKAELQQTAH